jgi:preprotein translocase subunit SecA
MSWIKKLNPFAKEEKPAEGGASIPGMPNISGMPSLPPELANDPKAKGMMAAFFRKWKDPAFIKQLRTLATHMQREGVDVKDMKAVQAWIEKNKERLEKGEFNEDAPGKPGETFEKTGPEVGRNDPCHCGSGKKFKKCHGK